jgi:hypothetical protein
LRMRMQWDALCTLQSSTCSGMFCNCGHLGCVCSGRHCKLCTL